MLRSALSLALFVTTLSAAAAQENPFVGGWRSVVVINGVEITIDLVMGSDMRFNEVEASYAGMTMQTGTYFVNAGQLTLNIEDWEPKTHAVYHPTGATGGYYTDEPSPRPPGGTYQVQFPSPSVMIMRNGNGVIEVSLHSNKPAPPRRPKEDILNSNAPRSSAPYGDAVQSNGGLAPKSFENGAGSTLESQLGAIQSFATSRLGPQELGASWQ